MGEILKSTAHNAPEPATPFEAYAIEQFKQIASAFTDLKQQITESVNDLAESIQFVANQAVTKDEFEERMSTMATKDDLKEGLKKCATKEDLAATEHRIKAYIDDKVVTQNIVPLIKAEDKKVNAVIDGLEEERVFTNAQVHAIKNQGPFVAAHQAI